MARRSVRREKGPPDLFLRAPSGALFHLTPSSAIAYRIFCVLVHITGIVGVLPFVGKPLRVKRPQGNLPAFVGLLLFLIVGNNYVL